MCAECRRRFFNVRRRQSMQVGNFIKCAALFLEEVDVVENFWRVRGDVRKWRRRWKGEK